MGAFQRDIEATLRDFVAYYNNERYRESLDGLMPAGVYLGRQYAMTDCAYLASPNRNNPAKPDA